MAELAVIGSLIGGLGTAVQGISANNSAKYEAAQMEAKGREELAASQRDAIQKRREGALVQSRQQALAAASGAGAGADAPTIVKLMSKTAGQTEYAAAADLYGGMSRKDGLFDGARARRASGKASLLGSVIGGFGQVASGFGKAYT